jgi:3-methyl-2-oxobutanoate hydroxymethyltransferase
LVTDDILGRYSDLTPRFVRRYMQSSALVKDVVRNYADDILSGSFPDNETEAFAFPEELLPELASFYEHLLKRYD